MSISALASAVAFSMACSRVRVLGLNRREKWFADGRKSVRFYWDNLVSRRLSPNTLRREQAIEKATALARAEMDKLDNPE